MPLPAQAEVRSRTRVTRVVDKGAGKGALVVTAREISTPTAASRWPPSSMCRSAAPMAASARATNRRRPCRRRRSAPDESVLLPTLPQQALLYRLNGDLNAVPRMAREAGFDRPILHGLCTYGMAGRALARACGQDGKRLASIATRFSAPFFPAKRCAWTSGATAGGCSSAPGRRSAAWRC